MTLRLDRADAFATHFEARLLTQTLHDGKPAVSLDQSAFYPTAGGQPHDTGTLNGVRVADVIEDKNTGDVLHVLERALGEDVGTVRGEIDFTRRFDHMQQHSGQHLLSRAFIETAGLDTVAVHIGVDACTLDLPTARLPAEMIDRAEDEANSKIYQDLPLRIYEVADTDLARIPLRKAPKVSGLVRIVEIEHYDWSACGGTHVRSCGQIGLIKIIRAEKRGTETRITFKCGQRALTDYRQTLRDAFGLSDSLTVARHDLPAAVNRLRDEHKLTVKALADAEGRLALQEADALLAEAPVRDGVRIVRAVWDGRDMNLLRTIAKRVCAQSGVVALLCGAGERAALCFARSAEGASGFDAAAALRTVLPQLAGAKGGGAPDFAQGGGVPADATTLRALIEKL
jgi:alanyl-tRNA synthetase